MFKKMIMGMLAATMIFSMTACSKNTGDNAGNGAAVESQETTLEGSAADVLAAVLTDTNVAGSYMLMEPMAIDLANTDSVKYYNGLDNADNMDEAVYVEPMIGSIPLSMSIVKVNDGADIEQMKEAILNGVDTRKWVCVEAEKIAVTNSGNYILMVMGNATDVDEIVGSFTETAENHVGDTLEKLTGAERFE